MAQIFTTNSKIRQDLSFSSAYNGGTRNWNNSALIKSNVVEEVSRLKAMPGQDILVAGSAQLVHTLMQHDLVDEYRLMVFPVVLGKGKRLFNEGSEMHALQMVEARPVGSAGVITLVYQPERKQ